MSCWLSNTCRAAAPHTALFEAGLNCAHARQGMSERDSHHIREHLFARVRRDDASARSIRGDRVGLRFLPRCFSMAHCHALTNDIDHVESLLQ